MWTPSSLELLLNRTKIAIHISTVITIGLCISGSRKSKSIDRSLGVLGNWKPLTHAKNIMLGTTWLVSSKVFSLWRWSHEEYIRYSTSNLFESFFVCHLFFDASQKVNPRFQSGIAQYTIPQQPLLNDDVLLGEDTALQQSLLNDDLLWWSPCVKFNHTKNNKRFISTVNQ